MHRYYLSTALKSKIIYARTEEAAKALFEIANGIKPEICLMMAI